MTLFLCRLGLHSWRKLPNSDNCYGMGLATFENWECRRCMTTHDRLVGHQSRRNPVTFTNLQRRSPDPCCHCGEDQNVSGKHDGYCGVC
jgi:hypothetical protein